MPDLKYFRADACDGFASAFKDAASSAFRPGARLAVKLHMGEGNRHHFDRDLAKDCVSVLKEVGMRPFLFDSPVMYSGDRHTVEGYLKRAAQNGFSEKTMGCPVVISNDSERVQGKYLPIGICRHIADADGLVLLSHLKGHPCSGAAGALKNLGMGGVDRETKTAIHGGSKAVLTGECDACGQCVEGCPGSAIRIRETAEIDSNSCWGCGRCVEECPKGALEPVLAMFGSLLIDGAAAVLAHVDRVLCVNDVRKITRLCDCCRDAGPEIAPDVGIFLGTDPVAIDQASVDLVIDAAGEDVFNREHGRNPYTHIKEAAARGLGSTRYRLLEP
jgi:uncharacterized Fe-S center protein